MKGNQSAIRIPRFLQTAIVGLMIHILVFPPAVWGGTATWNGGDSTYTDVTKWTCGDCGLGFTYPDGPHDVTIDNGQVTLDTVAGINYLNIGFSGDLTVSSGSLTVGTGVSGTVLTNGGMINLTGGNLVLAGGIGDQVTVDGYGQILISGTGSLSTTANLTTDNLIALSGPASQLAANSLSLLEGSLTLESGANVAIGGLSNHGGLIDIGSLSTADFRTGGTDTFTNLSGDGLLTGGSYTVGGLFLYDASSGAAGGKIRTIDTGTSLSLIGGGQIGYGSLTVTNALDELQANHGALSLAAGATLSTPGDFDNQGGLLFMYFGSSLTVNGNFDNGSVIPGFTTAAVSGNLNVIGSIINGGNLDTLYGSTTTSAGLTNMSTGSILVDSGSTLNVTGGNFSNLSGGILSGGEYIVGGEFRFDGGPIHIIDGNTTLVLDGFNNALISGGNDALAGLTIVHGNLDIFSADRTFTPTGQFLVGSGAFATFSDSANVTINGAIENHGDTFVGYGSTLTAVGALNNSGLLTFVGGGFGAALGFTNSGSLVIDGSSSLNVQGGTFTNLDLGGTLSGGNYDIEGSFVSDGGDILTIDSNTSLTLRGSGSMTNSSEADTLANLQQVAGAFSLYGGAVRSFTPATGSFNVTASGTFQVGSDLDSWAEATIEGDFSNAGSTNVAGTGLLTVNGNATNSGNLGIDVASGMNVLGDAFNTSDGVVNLSAILTATGQFTNEGSVTVEADGVLTAADYLQTSGTTTVNTGGQLTAANVILQGGTLAGFGTINGNVDNQAGNVAPGDPGVMTINGNYTQHAAGMMQLQFADEFDYDQIVVNGDVNLNGTLQIDLINGFNPLAGMSFVILSWTGALTNFSNFSSFIFPSLAGLTWHETINANDITLSLVSSEVPEPGTFGLAFALLGAGVMIARRRSRKV